MKIKLHKTQYDVAKDQHRFRVVCAGRRWGKSVLAQLIVLQWAVRNPGGLFWIVSPTYRQSKQIHWRQLNQIVPKLLVEKKNEVELSITLKNGSIIELKGAENPDALRGVKLRGLVIDEIASIRNWNWLWAEVLRPTLTDYMAPALFISTPKGYNHFYDLYTLGQGSSMASMDDNQEEGNLYKSWKFTSYDNPYIPKEEIDNAKAELTEDTFYQEYMADFRKYTGLVYKGFDRDLHVIERFTLPAEWEIFRAIDFGSTNPTACLWIACDGDGNWYIVDEHYETGQTIDYHSGVINSNPASNTVVATYGDPSGAQWIQEFAQRGVYITPATKESGQNNEGWVRYGIEKVSEKLKSMLGHFVPVLDGPSQGKRMGMPSLFVFNSCVNTIREFETYRWKEKAVTQAQDLNEPDAPEKANDHAMDALRYFAVSYGGKQDQYIAPKDDVSNLNWSLE